MTQEPDSAVLNHPRFVGLWTYRPFSEKRQFCASVMIGGVVCETKMHDTWGAALQQARAMLLSPDEATAHARGRAA